MQEKEYMKSMMLMRGHLTGFLISTRYRLVTGFKLEMHQFTGYKGNLVLGSQRL